MKKIIASYIASFYFVLSALFIATVFTSAYLSDNETSSGNSFTAAAWTVTPTPTVTPTQASLVINEVSSAGSEWIELFYSGGALLLNNYTINDVYSSVHIKNLNGYNIPASGYLVLYKSTDFTFDLNDGHDALELKKSGDLVDRVEYGTGSGNAPIPASGQSIARHPNGTDTNNDAADFTVGGPSLGVSND